MCGDRIREQLTALGPSRLMVSMRILTQLPQDDLLAVPATARAAETAGFNGLTTSENKNDPFLALAVAAVSTQHASLQTSIAIAFSRSPMAVANAKIGRASCRDRGHRARLAAPICRRRAGVGGGARR